MGRGFLAGILWGGVVGVGLLLVSSQVLERQQLSFPKPEASAVEVPGGSEFDQARAETDPVLPGTEDTPAPDETAVLVVPDDGAADTPPTIDTSALEVPTPRTSAPETLGDAPEVPTDDIVAPSGDAGAAVEADTPALETPERPAATPETDTEAPEAGEAPESEDLTVVEAEAEPAPPSADTEVAALPDAGEDQPVSTAESAPAVSIDVEAPSTPTAPQISESPSLPGVRTVEADEIETTAPSPTPVETVEPAPVQPTVPSVLEVPDSGGTVTADGGVSRFSEPVVTIQDRAENVETGRLPSIGADEEAPATLPIVRRLPGQLIVTTEPAATDDGDAAEPTMDGPALKAFAMDFEVPDGGAQIAVVLLHEGPELLPEADLNRLPATVVFGVDAAAPNAASVAKAYRAAGREVVLIPALPAGAAPQDVEVTLAGTLEQFPQAVALMDVTGSSFQSDRAAVSQVVAVASDTGHGIVTFPRGLNTAHQQAERAGVPTGLIFRVLDDDDQTDEQIRRTFDRAAFRARQSDAVILVGHTRPGTIAAVSGWVADAGDTAALVPISAALSSE